MISIEFGSFLHLSTSSKVKSEFSGFFISARKNHDLWQTWAQQWETNRLHHNKIKNLLAILQEAISEYQQDIPAQEIETGINNKLLTLGVINNDEKPEEVVNNSTINSLVVEETSEIRRQTSHHSIDIEQKQYTTIEQPPK